MVVSVSVYVVICNKELDFYFPCQQRYFGNMLLRKKDCDQSLLAGIAQDVRVIGGKKIDYTS